MTLVSVLRRMPGLFILALCTCALPQIADHHHSLYLLSGTIDSSSASGYPSTLYTLSQGQLIKVREIVAPPYGIESVQQTEEAIFVAYPHAVPTVISVIHASHPADKDEVVFNPTHGIDIVNAQAASTARTDVEELLMLSAPSGSTVECVSVASDGKGRDRVRTDAANDYAAVLFKGTPGGGNQEASLVGHIHDGLVQVFACGTFVTIAKLSPQLARDLGDTPGGVIAANNRFMIIVGQASEQEFTSKSIATKTQSPVYVLNRQTGLWSSALIKGTCSSSRIFGEWLATDVSFFDFSGKLSPGTQNERNTESATRPNIRDLFAAHAAEECYFPGVLALQNLVTNELLTIQTGQEDSEVLTMDGSNVVYRVNDAIYTAAITRNALSHPILLAKDGNIPDVHWAFWSR